MGYTFILVLIITVTVRVFGNYEVSEKSFLFVNCLADLSLGGISLACGCLHVCCIRNAGTNVISVCVQVCSVSCIIAYQLLCV